MRLIEQVLTTVHHGRRLYWRAFQPTVVGVRALIVRDGRVMLVRHTYLPGFYLPGGKVDRGETALSACCREVAEECALTVTDARLVGIYSNIEQNRNDHILLFLASEFSPARSSLLRRLEIAEAAFYPIDDLPAGTTPATVRRLAEFRRQRSGSAAPFFDGEYW